jgi:hypothetical protein
MLEEYFAVGTSVIRHEYVNGKIVAGWRRSVAHEADGM